jgi:four helix bundle protein
MEKAGKKKIEYDLEERTFRFARNVRSFFKTLPNTIANRKDILQLIDASGSVGANYIEANESLSKKDCIFRMKISRKEAKEAAYWLKLLVETNEFPSKAEGVALYNEAVELKKIFSAIIQKLS